MAWANSKVFRPLINDFLTRTASFTIDIDGADTIKVALYNNSITPDTNVTAANSAYNAGQWANTNEVTDATNWVAGGRALASITFAAGTGTLTYDANDLSGGGNVTLANVFGCLVYDDTIASPVADQGFCFNYFGGSQSVTAGTFTIVWNANGIFRITF